MPSILDIRRRIRSVINTRQITKAMKMVSAARLRRAQDRALAARPYAQMLTNVLRSLVQRADVYDPVTGEPLHPLLVRRDENNILLIVVSGEKGLAGAFNTNINKAALRFIESKSGKNIDVETIGRKGRDFLRRRYPVAEWVAQARTTPVAEVAVQARAEFKGKPRAAQVELVEDHPGVLNRINFEQIQEIAQDVIERYTNASIDAVYIVYNEFKSVIAQRLVVEQVLPIGEIGETAARAAAEEMTEEQRRRSVEAAESAGVSLQAPDTAAIDERAAQFGTAQVDYIYEQPPQELFRSMLPRYLALQIYRAALESTAAEHAARMTAMDSATNNASDMIDSLTLVMNRVRQAKITKEIIEIVSGAAAAG
jgi:F-type H+-transporting ATPase subunit gamma